MAECYLERTLDVDDAARPFRNGFGGKIRARNEFFSSYQPRQAIDDLRNVVIARGNDVATTC